MSIWSQALSLAEQTPASRNRYVDFLRAVSITVVIVGHWLIATAWMVDGEMVNGHLLKTHSQTHWLTWVFQVMPIFFIVGGYANAVSLESARAKGSSYADWLVGRLHRLVAPLLLLLVSWAGIALTMYLLGTRPEVLKFASQAALIPTWFLAIYIMVVILAPATYRFWQRAGLASIAAFAAVAVLVDVAFFALQMHGPGWTNYFWVWLSVHQLGYAWRDGRLGSPVRMLLLAAAAFLTLWMMTMPGGPYPLAMVGSPDPGLSNTLPPKVTLLVLGLFQFGILMALEGPARRMLESVRLWAATVLVNSMIMTVYLWHITVMVVLLGVLYLLGGPGLGFEPGTTDWWLTRPVWIAVLLALLIPVALPVSALERRPRGKNAPVPSAARQVIGAMMLCLGVSLLAMFGFGDGSLLGLDEAAFALVLIGAGVSGLLPRLGKKSG